MEISFFKDKMNLYINQNILLLLLGLFSLGFSEYYNLKSLYILALILTITMIISVLACMVAYTFHYINKKSFNSHGKSK
jgi:tellurite resistance protein TehA-like permease